VKIPRFSLRLLLLAVAVLCAWLAWLAKEQRNVVLQRRRMVEELRSDSLVEVHNGLFMSHPVFNLGLLRIPRSRDGVPWVRAMMGDEPVVFIRFQSKEDSRIEDAHKILPEANIEAGPLAP
jgi:hypothetical protein